MKDPRRNLREYRNKVTAAKQRAKRSGAPTHCWICRQPIDLDLDYRDKWAMTLDHLESLKTGGHIMGETLPAHRSCNSSRGTGEKVEKFPTTREW